jgi:ligand-binding SRPBCC domain-containing protein
MPTLEFEATLAAPLAKVWAMFSNVQTLAAISPPEDRVVIESADEPIGVGSRIVITAAGPLGRRMRWVAKIVEHRPPHSVVFGEEARFVDEQESGPFAYWRHEHDFERVDEKTTRLIDRITYRVPLGPVGWIADYVFVRRKLRRMFRYRYEQVRKIAAPLSPLPPREG